MSQEYCLKLEYWPQSGQRTILEWTLYLIMVCYLVCMGLALYNTYEYMYRGGRWRIKLMTAFYAVVIALLVSRILCLTYFILFYEGKCEYKSWGDLWDTLATYLKAVLGVQQLVSMLELSIHIKYQSKIADRSLLRQSRSSQSFEEDCEKQ
jgi:hypothetical protein